jgi:hypothetical protein
MAARPRARPGGGAAITPEVGRDLTPLVRSGAAGASETLPSLIDRAARALGEARSSGEVLEARDLARVAYDVAKSAGRMARAKDAHDQVIRAVHRAQADALIIEARAKMRLADEYDAAQARGEEARLGDNLPSVAAANSKPATAADLGLRRDEIYEARRLRDAERAEPGLAQQAVDRMVEAGEEPSRAELRRSILVKDVRRRPMSRNPYFQANARRDHVQDFTGACRGVAGFHNLEALAEFDGHPEFRRQMLAQARAARGVLERFFDLLEGDNAETKT